MAEIGLESENKTLFREKWYEYTFLLDILSQEASQTGSFFGHVYLFSRYMSFFVRFLSRFSSRHPFVLVLRANRGDGEPRAHASKVERCDSLKDGSDGLFACSLRCVV